MDVKIKAHKKSSNFVRFVRLRKSQIWDLVLDFAVIGHTWVQGSCTKVIVSGVSYISPCVIFSFDSEYSFVKSTKDRRKEKQPTFT